MSQSHCPHRTCFFFFLITFCFCLIYFYIFIYLLHTIVMLQSIAVNSSLSESINDLYRRAEKDALPLPAALLKRAEPSLAAPISCHPDGCPPATLGRWNDAASSLVGRGCRKIRVLVGRAVGQGVAAAFAVTASPPSSPPELGQKIARPSSR